MIITHKIEMDLSRRGVTPRIDAVQGDALTRQIQLELYSNGTAWEIPEGVSVLVRFVKPDGTGGIYDTLPDGTAACTMEGNTVSVILAPAVTTVSGAASLAVTLIQGDAELSSFSMTVNVQPNPNAEIEGDINSITLSTLVEQAVEAYMEENPAGSGLTSAQINALDAMFKITAFTTDPTSAYAAFKEAFGIGSGSDEPDEPVVPDEPDEPAEVPATRITLSASSMSFSELGSQILIATVEPSNTTDTVEWSTSAEGVATVSSGGVVTAVADGTAIITATAGSVSASCEVSVALAETYESGYLNDSGVLTESNLNFVSTAYKPVTAGDEVALDIYACRTGINKFRINEYDSDKNFIQRQYCSKNTTTSWEGALAKFTLSATTAFVRVGFELSDTATDFVDSVFANYKLLSSADVEQSAVELTADIGNLSSSDGSEIDATDRLRTDYAEVDSSVIWVMFKSDTTFSSSAARKYDANKAFTTDSASTKYIRVLLVTSDPNTAYGTILYIAGTFYKVVEG